jgi:dipeptidyl aminopeptidase/acylaminoacyl peptidase
MLIDFEDGKTAPLSAAPAVPQMAAPIWIDGGRRVILASGLEALEGVSASQKAVRSRRYAVQVFDPTTRRAQVIAYLDPDVRGIRQATWRESQQTLTLIASNQKGQQLQPMNFRRVKNAWRRVEAHVEGKTAPSNERNRVIVIQSLNEPPRLAVRNGTEGAVRTVLDLDPWVREYRLARVEEIAWSDSQGRRWHGGVYFPSGFDPAVRYPVVIQTHGFDKNKFSLSGVSSNFAAQALAARGIMVLQVADEDAVINKGSLSELDSARLVYESAIDYLDARAWIDPQRIGIQGWSRTGPWVGGMLTRSSRRIAAAALTSTTDFGWWYYVSMGARSGESAYGTPPVGQGLDVWREQAATFNVEKVQAPVFMWGNGSVAGLWDWYALLKRLGKPVEYWYLPDGAHEAFKIGERIRMNELLVDWFDFWLRRKEDSDPAKAEQYARWNSLRNLEGSVEARSVMSNQSQRVSDEISIRVRSSIERAGLR